MFLSLAIMLSVGMGAGFVCKKLRLPALLGMLLTGLLIGPFALNLIDASVLTLSPQLRKIALIVILTRAGLSLDLTDLKKAGRPAVLMCFLPACFEMGGMVLLAPPLLGVSVQDAAIMGAVVGAVSPAVIVPKMLRLLEEGYGRRKGIPQLILAGASVDDIFVIVMFTVFSGLAQTGRFSLQSLLTLPASLLTGAAAGLLSGWLLAKLFGALHIRDTAKILLLLSLSFLFVALEERFSAAVPFSSLLAVMCAGITLKVKKPAAAERLSARYGKVWVGAEILLFVLVGAAVDPSYAFAAGPIAVGLIAAALLTRMLGVWVCLLRTRFTAKERLFCMLAYTPKATVQAAIGGIPLAMGLSCGNIVLTVAVLSILITAPLGAFAIDLTFKKLLTRDPPQ